MERWRPTRTPATDLVYFQNASNAKHFPARKVSFLPYNRRRDPDLTQDGTKAAATLCVLDAARCQRLLARSMRRRVERNKVCLIMKTWPDSLRRQIFDAERAVQSLRIFCTPDPPVLKKNQRNASQRVALLKLRLKVSSH